MTIPGAETIGERVARVRRRQKLSVRDLAAKAEIAPKTVSNVEAGIPPRGNTLGLLADALGVPVEWLRDGK